MTPSKAFGEGESEIDTLLSNRVNSVIIFCRLRPKDESIEKKYFDFQNFHGCSLL